MTTIQTLCTVASLACSLLSDSAPAIGKSDSSEVTLASSPSRPSKMVHEFRLADVPVMKQERRNDCWATTAAMMQSWKTKEVVSPRMLATQTGPLWLRRYEEDTGLFAEEKEDFLNAAGLVYEIPMSYSPSAVEDMLRKFGPLWFTVGDRDSIMTHANLLIGISYLDNDEITLTYIDPADGIEYVEKYGSFMRRYEAPAHVFNDLYMDELINGDFIGVQVVHFAEGH